MSRKRLINTIPDFIDHAAKAVGEVKDVAKLGWNSQIRAQYEWAKRNGYTYTLFIRKGTKLVGELTEYIDLGLIRVVHFDDLIP